MAYADDVLADSPVAYYKLDETSGSVAVDSSGNGLDGSHFDSPIFSVLGPIDGEDDRSTFYRQGLGVWTDTPSDASLAFTTNASIEAWTMWRNGSILLRDSTNANGWILAFDNAGTLNVRAGGTNFSTGLTTTSVLKDGQWHHIVLTKSGGTVTLYIDGTSVYSSGGAGSTAAVVPWRICRNGTSGSLVHCTAAMAHVAFYNSALSAARVAVHYRAAKTFNEILLTRTGQTLVRHIRNPDNATAVEFEQTVPDSVLITATSPQDPGVLADLGAYPLGTELRFRINGTDAENNLSDKCVVAYYPTPPPPTNSVNTDTSEINGPCYVLWWEDTASGVTEDYDDVMSWVWQPIDRWTVGFIGFGPWTV